MPPSELPQWCRSFRLPCPGGDYRPWSYHSGGIYRLPPAAQGVIAALGVTKVSRPSCDCRLRSYQSSAIYRLPRPSPGGDCRPRSYQSVAIYRLRAHAQVVIAALGVTKMLAFLVFPAQVAIADVGVTEVSLFIVLPPCPNGGCRPQK